MTAPAAKTALIILLLGGAALSTLLYLGTDEDQSDAENPGLSLSFYLQGAVLTATDESGAVIYRMSTEYAEQRPDDLSIHMRNVDMRYGASEKTGWALRADTGSMPEDAKVITFSGNVIAELGDLRTRHPVIRTQQLEFDPATLLATTTHRVVIDFDNRILNALGLKANLETNTLELMSNVHGKFNP